MSRPLTAREALAQMESDLMERVQRSLGRIEADRRDGISPSQYQKGLVTAYQQDLLTLRDLIWRVDHGPRPE